MKTIFSLLVAVVCMLSFSVSSFAAETLTTPEIIEALVSFRGWEAKNRLGCNTSRKEFDITRIGDDSVDVPSGIAYYGGPNEESVVGGSSVMQVTGPVLKYVTHLGVCTLSVYDHNHGNWPDYCFYKMENEIKVVSKTLVKVTRKQLSGGSGITTCTFEKK